MKTLDSGAGAIAGCLGVVGVMILILPVAAVVDGWAISVLWNWFVVPFLHAPRLQIAAAIGLSLVWHAFAHVTQTEPAVAKEKTFLEKAGNLFVGPLIGVGVGWIVRMFV